MIWRSVSAIIAFLSISGYLKMHFRITSRAKKVVQFHEYKRMSQNYDSYFKCYRYLFNFTLFSIVDIFLLTYRMPNHGSPFSIVLFLQLKTNWNVSWTTTSCTIASLHYNHQFTIIQMQSFCMKLSFYPFYPFIRYTLLFTWCLKLYIHSLV